MPLQPLLTARWNEPRSFSLETYERTGGYQALRTALAMEPEAVIAEVKASGLRGRGGAGFPTGMKWSFIPQGDGKPHYLVVNADEGEPGTCRDAPLMMADPHSLIEGSIIACHAVRASEAFIYLRGELVHALRRVQHAVAEATAAGYLGQNILGSGVNVTLVVHAGAGAYICGEETALLDSLEGYRGQPRLKPPFPATAGLYGCPTVVNNVGTLATVPTIIANGAAWFKAIGPEGSPGTSIFSLTGRVTRPGQYEAPMGTTLRELLVLAGGIRTGHQLKFWTPGGSSTPMFTAEHLDVPLDFDSVAKAGSLNGTSALMLFDETDCVVRATLKWTQFYVHESCGKCTPCREGTYWLGQILNRIEQGEGTLEDLTTLTDTCANIFGRAFCAFGDGAISPIVSSLQFFRDEYLAHIEGRRCPLAPSRALVGAGS